MKPALGVIARRGLAGAAVFGVAACALQSLPQPVTEFSSGPVAAIVMDLPGDEVGRGVEYSDWMQSEYYVRVGGPGGDAEVDVSEIVDSNRPFSLEYYFTIEDGAKAWNANKAADLIWLDGGKSFAGPLEVYWRSYVRDPLSGAAARPCVAFSAEWGIIGQDPRQRPADAMFGYYCAPPRKNPLTVGEIDAVVGSIRFVGPGDVGMNPAPVPDTDALSWARGGGNNAGLGLDRFPLEFAVQYPDADASDTFF